MLALKTRLALVALGLLVAAQSHAAGFAAPTSVVGLSEAGATVADGGPVSSFADNPADMVFFPGTRVGLDILATHPTYTMDNNNVTYDASSNMQILPNLFVTHRFNDLPLAVGLGITSPFNTNNTWSAGTFGATQWKNDLQIIDVNPGVAYLLFPNLSVGVGLDYYQTLSATFGPNSGSGGGVGGNVGLFYTTERFNAGLSYRSAASISSGGGSVDLPSRVQAGVRYRFTPRFATELDVDWNDWSNAQLPGYGSLGWKSTMAYRIGLSYHLNQDLELRGGLAHEGSPTSGSSIQAAVPTASSNLASFGVGIGLGPWHYDLGASYAISGNTSSYNHRFPGTYKASTLNFGAAISRDF
ncbi:Membrane protein involved in aromatic hydrocarbon degradation [Acidithiobacillus ferrivorans]|uniref:Membrane protein involved in aromatic hydrocarbon degradation n=1 Tax=Acidithiobacillus ferrivorans TaxID=160808 RepID=A0A060US14_9PROT|nr:outer membrane protein transport protein [Acidithiobacillus ferrivorans]CDQ11091.1 Membrane protein involved in aromatic hydrocarbon degradation [Acidithiobacillus ferrivorans]SMH65822.1 Membrane protein involved in aromatic hydrocarbon degradation [Acidithiobacillus ferrivorans]